eukprot:TRINITY_DN25457_c0_g1_i1.p1 TRINITY_DN25457_c0_g1~~TRINITY_DN25457_c0_g1_i1.p1  ORF type:complete len:319 (+),score=73.27 TRINITY_DN25457_c0_g1_i1:50-958(+)
MGCCQSQEETVASSVQRNESSNNVGAQPRAEVSDNVPAQRDKPPEPTPASPSVAAARPSSFVCPKCQISIDAALFDGHRETCRILTPPPDATPTPPPDPDPGLPRTTSGRALRRCRHCGEAVHPLLLNGHEANCGQNAERRTSARSEEDVDEAELCCICYAHRRNQAFLPCGHWACCGPCSRQLQQCPLCREDVKGFVAVSATEHVDVCKVCKLHIHPTFLVSHREVCRMQMKRRREERLQSGEAPQIEDGGEAKCVRCREMTRDTAFVPCGHLLCCASCAAEADSCPICLRPVQSVLPIWT